MTVHAVFIHCSIAGYHSRWIDTQWPTHELALSRALELDRVLSAFKVPEHKTTILELTLENVAIQDSQPPQPAQTQETP